MTYKYTFLAVMLLQTYSVLSQMSHWVSNRNDGVEVDFTNAQAAYNTALPGDTLIFYPSPYSYGGLTIDKEIHIIGLGYKIDTISQPTLGIRTFLQTTIFDQVALNAGSENSTIESISIQIYNVNNVNNTTIRRCEIREGAGVSNSIAANFYSTTITKLDNGWSLNMIDADNCIIANCIFTSPSSSSVNGNGNSTNNIFFNNIIYQGYLNNCTFYNNIFPIYDIIGNMNEVTNNIYLSGTPGEDDFNNIYGATNVFVGYPTQGSYSFDTRWQLQSNSPAIGAGVDGEDCGIFGGPNPYKLSGIHSRPLIYELTAPVYVPNGSDLNITVKVRAED